MDRLLKTLHLGFLQTPRPLEPNILTREGMWSGSGHKEQGESDGPHNHVTQDSNGTHMKIQECVSDWRGWWFDKDSVSLSTFLYDAAAVTATASVI